MAITPKRRNGHARRHPKLRSFQGLPFFAKGRTLDLSTTTGSNADVSVEWFWVTMDGLGDPDLLVSELLVGFSSARNSWAALQLSLVPNFRRADFRCSLTVLPDRPFVSATSFERMGVSSSRSHAFSPGVVCSIVHTRLPASPLHLR